MTEFENVVFDRCCEICNEVARSPKYKAACRSASALHRWLRKSYSPDQLQLAIAEADARGEGDDMMHYAIYANALMDGVRIGLALTMDYGKETEQ